jgi:hypothetical protein
MLPPLGPKCFRPKTYAFFMSAIKSAKLIFARLSSIDLR